MIVIGTTQGCPSRSMVKPSEVRPVVSVLEMKKVAELGEREAECTALLQLQLQKK